MNPDILTEVIACRLEDFAEQYHYLVSQGKHKEAETLVTEGAMIAQAYDNNDVFLVLDDFTGTEAEV